MSVISTQLSRPFPIRKTNSTDAAYTTNTGAKVATVTAPSGVGDAVSQATFAVVDIAGIEGALCANSVLLMPFGVGSDNNTMLMRVWGWSYVSERSRQFGQGPKGYWYARPLLEVTCTLSSTCVAGVTDGLFGATNLFADTIVLTGTTGNAGVGCDIVSPANNTPGHIELALRGCDKMEIAFGLNSSSTSNNCMCQLLW